MVDAEGSHHPQVVGSLAALDPPWQESAMQHVRVLGTISQQVAVL